MAHRLRLLGIVAAVIGVGIALVGVYGYTQVQAGYKSLAAFSAAQNVKLTYNDAGQLVDQGKTENAQAILKLLKDDWKFDVKSSELDPKDPVVNTATEYMYQMATITHHIQSGTQKVVLDKDVDFKGQTIKAGTYDFPVAGRYWTAFDRTNPIEAKARELAWTGTAHGLIGELGVGTVTASTLQLGLGFSLFVLAMGLLMVLMGGGLVWTSRAI
jgi:hypothetical protein